MADILIKLMSSMAAQLGHSDLRICQNIAAELIVSRRQPSPVPAVESFKLPGLKGVTQKYCSQFNPLLAEYIQQAAPELAWRRPGFGRIPDDIAKHMAVCEIIGPTGQLNHENIRAGLLYQAAGITYPRHSHAAEEIYAPLSGPAEWQRDDEDWKSRNAGEYIHHLPYQPHGIKTGKIPLLAVWGWTGDIRSESYEI